MLAVVDRDKGPIKDNMEMGEQPLQRLVAMANVT